MSRLLMLADMMKSLSTTLVYGVPCPSYTRPQDRKPRLAPISAEVKEELVKAYDETVESIKEKGNHNKATGETYGCGLYNLGNTCFMNSALQPLLHTPELTEVFTRDSFLSKVNVTNKLGTKGVMSATFSALCDEVLSGAYSAVGPNKFHEAFGRVNSYLTDGRQHDASEFQTYLLDSLHEDTNLVQKKVPFEQDYNGNNILRDAADYQLKMRQFAASPVSEIFNLQTVSQLSCRRCGERSVTFEESGCLSLGLPTNEKQTTLDECLEEHFEDVDLDDDCRWNCPNCERKVRATRTTRLWSLPPVLIVQLKRFSAMKYGFRKNQMAVHFPQSLNLEEFVHADSNSEGMYELYAVTNHSGGLSGGHYTAIAQHCRSKRWLYFKDSGVSDMENKSPDPEAAYLLFYRRQ